MYGSWLRAENNESFLFVNLPEKEGVDWKVLALKETSIEEIVEQKTTAYQIGEISSMAVDNTEGSREKTATLEFQNALEMHNELHALNLTLKMQDLGHTQALKEAVNGKIQNSNFDPQELYDWATSFIQSLASIKAQKRRNYEGYDLIILEFANLGPSKIQKASEEKTKGLPSPIICGKRPATNSLHKAPKGVIIREVEDIHQIDAEEEDLEPICSLGEPYNHAYQNPSRRCWVFQKRRAMVLEESC